MIYESVFAAVDAERERQKTFVTEVQDDQNTYNDWVAFITAYLGRAAAGVYRNNKENQTFRDNMIKVAALAIAALEADERRCSYGC